MWFSKVRLEAIGVGLPEEIVSSADLESQLTPIYERLRLPEGRLELMTGIRERRIWPAGTRPSGPSIATANQMLDTIGFDRRHVGCLIHASVCRDFLEPATAALVHDGLGLSSSCWTYDISNACLGLLNGLTQIAALIESGAIKAGIVVGTENSRSLLEQTVRYLNGNSELTRQSIKPALASLTIGSASCAMLLVHESLSESGASVLTSVARCHSLHNNLCRSDHDSAGAGMQPLMDTDAEQLLHAGIAAGVDTFAPFLAESQWSVEDLDATICHQVGGRHRAAMLESLGLSTERDTATFSWMGNTGSVALPTALAAAAAWGRVQPLHRVGLLGIGSGINCVMVGSEWSHVTITGNMPEVDPTVDAKLLASVRRLASSVESPSFMIDVWRIDLDACPCTDKYAWLPPDDQLRVTRMGTERLRARMAAMRMAQRLILSQYLATMPSQVPILISALGCPYLEKRPDSLHVHFNLTHAEGRMMLAVSTDQTVGVDLEYVHRRIEPDKLAPIVLTVDEQTWLQTQPDQLVAFLNIWTAKEAALKLWGTGLQIPAKLVSLDWEAATATVSREAKYHSRATCFVSRIEANCDWLAHLATSTPAGEIILKDFEWN